MERVEYVLKQGRPLDEEGRLDKEIRVYDFLDALHIRYEQVDHPPAYTMEECERVDRIVAPASVCKNLFLCNASKTAFYLLLMRGDKRYVTKDVARQLGSGRLSFAPETFMQQYLDIMPGSVSVLGLMNDKENMVHLLVDEDLLKEPFIAFHPCVNTASLRLKTEDVFTKFLSAIAHSYTLVKIA